MVLPRGSVGKGGKDMQERIQEELALLRKSYPDTEYVPDGQWVRIRKYPLATGWNSENTEVVFQIPAGYPGAHPYGIYVPAGLLYQGARPQNYTEPAQTKPPFQGTWGIFSWQPANWSPSAKIVSGSNLWSWVRGFSARFKEGI
jgi:hypothetical protein